MKGAVHRLVPAEQRSEPSWKDRQPVSCACGHTIFDGLMIKARAVRVLENGAEAKCKRCKEWTLVPLTYAAI